MTEDDEDEVETHDHEAPDESDWNDEPGEVKCPDCGRHVSEDADQCPYCGYYIVHEEPAGARGKPWWWVLAVVLLLLAFLKYLRW